MQKRKQQILDAAARLFARQGYHATSIQEIVDEVGIAKGSIYFYFKSKEELLVSLLETYEQAWYRNLADQSGDEDLPARERLRMMLKRLFKYLEEHADFLTMLLKEPVTGGDAIRQEQLRTIIFRIRSRFLYVLYRHVQDVYGPETERYRADGVLLLNGMIMTFLESMILVRHGLNGDRMPDYILNRLDDAMHGLANAGEPPLLRETEFRRWLRFGLDASASGTPLLPLLEQLTVQAEGTGAEDAAKLLVAELGKSVPHPVLVEALLTLLEKQAERELKETIAEIKSRLEKG